MADGFDESRGLLGEGASPFRELDTIIERLRVAEEALRDMPEDDRARCAPSADVVETWQRRLAVCTASLGRIARMLRV